MFINFQPLERFENRSNVRDLGRLRNSLCSRVVNELKTITFSLREIEKKRITVVNSRVYKQGSNTIGSKRVKSISDVTKV
jgi:hypothetical protein